MKFKTWVYSAGGVRVVAEQIGCSEVSVRKYITGDRRPRPDVAERIEMLSEGQINRASWYWQTEAS